MPKPNPIAVTDCGCMTPLHRCCPVSGFGVAEMDKENFPTLTSPLDAYHQQIKPLASYEA